MMTDNAMDDELWYCSSKSSRCKEWASNSPFSLKFSLSEQARITENSNLKYLKEN